MKKFQDKSEKKYNNYFEKLDLTNKMKYIPQEKNKNTEIKINSIIQNYNKNNSFLVNPLIEKNNNKNAYSTNNNEINLSNKFSSNKAKINNKEIKDFFYSTLSKISKDFSIPKIKKIEYNLNIDKNPNLFNNILIIIMLTT